MWTTVTMDNGVLVMIGGGWNLPPSYPNYCSTWIEITGTEGALILDDTHARQLAQHRDGGHSGSRCRPCRASRSTTCSPADGAGDASISSKPASCDTPVMVTPESARMVMETYTAADLSAERNEPVDLPLTNETHRGGRRFKAKSGGRQRR